MCHDHEIIEREAPSEEAEAARREAELEAELEAALTGEDGRVFVPPAD